jgi:exonuclease SbcC
MRPGKLEVINFLSYRGEHAVEFDGVTLAALIGPNGAGKSSLIDAIRFALFGHTRGGADGVITQGEDVCRVAFEFALGEDVYLVSRQRSRKGAGNTLLSFQMLTPEGAVVLDGKSVAETQRRIEAALHLTDELFCVTACASQGNVAAFSQAKPAARKQVLSDILDLAAWDRRAEAARQIGRDVSAELTTTREQLSRAEQKAGGAETIRAGLAEATSAQARTGEAVQRQEAAVTEALSAKEQLVREESEDRARRQELTDLGGRVADTKTSLDEATGRQAQLSKAVSGKALLLDAITKAEAAQTAAQEMEGKRQEDERLAHEAELLEQQRRAAVTEHVQAVQTLKDRIAQVQASHRRQVEAVGQRIQDLTAQAEPLTRVPCAGTEPAESCPLIEAARKAKEALPAVQAELTALTGSDPTAEDTAKLAALEAKPAGRPARKRLRELAAQRAETGYDAKEHARAKQLAGKLRDLQEALHKIERAEAQLAEVRPQVERLTAELKQLTERQAALQKALGPPRDWPAEVAAADRTIAQCRAGIIFTEHRDTLDYIVRRLQGIGYAEAIATIHGGMPYTERESQVEAFRERCRFLVATDAAGEGINLQFCWLMVNYDIPWNPARLEQRLGRRRRSVSVCSPTRADSHSSSPSRPNASVDHPSAGRSVLQARWSGSTRPLRHPVASQEGSASRRATSCT